jgi:thymidine kinase
MGQLEVITGPMFSGKSEELLRRLRRAKIAGKNVVLVSPKIDTRSNDLLVTHSGAEFQCIKTSLTAEILDLGNYYDVIGIDEIQFFAPSVVTTILYLVKDRTVIVSGLDTNYRFEPWAIVPELMAYAEKVDKLTAICNRCGLEGTRTQRLIDGAPAPLDGPEVLIGGLESYEARCRDHWEAG